MPSMPLRLITTGARAAAMLVPAPVWGICNSSRRAIEAVIAASP